MPWKNFTKKIRKILSQYMQEDIQYSKLKKSQISQIAAREIAVFIEYYKKWTPEQQFLRENQKISLIDQKELNKFIIKRKAGIPLAYIIRQCEFYGLNLKVNKDALIPRPETEELVDYAIQRLKKYKNKPVALIDIGTGSGCILAAVLKNLPKDVKLSKIYAVEPSPEALKIAKYNLKKNLGSKYKINYVNGSLIDFLKIKQMKSYFITANLPYLSQREYRNLSPEVRNNEPKEALFGGEGGHGLICKLIKGIYEKIHGGEDNMKSEFELILEISPTIYPAIIKYCASLSKPLRIRKKIDMSGKIRMLRINF